MSRQRCRACRFRWPSLAAAAPVFVWVAGNTCRARVLAVALTGLVVATALCGCASEKPQVIVKTAPGHSGQNTTVSVLGAYAAGRMSPEQWREMAPAVAAAFGSACDAGFSDELQKTKPRWFSMIDQTTRDEGVTEDLLRQIAPAARGGTIVLIEAEWGEPSDQPPSSGPSPVSQATRGRGRGRSGRHASGSSETRPKARESLYAVGALAFSVDKGAFVAEIRATGAYKDREQTLRLFVDQLRAAFPQSGCVGWHWETEGP